MGTPARSPEMLAAFVEAYKANGEQPRKAATAIGRSGGSGHEIFAACVRAGLLEPRTFWKPTRQTTTRDADENITATYIQERPDTGDTAAEPLPGFAIARRTVHRVGGEITQVWEQEKPGAAIQLEALRIFAAALTESTRSMAPITAPPVATDDDLMVLYPVGDPHFGLYSYADETGEDFDLDEAERVTCEAVDRLVATAPNATTGYFLVLGDTTHADDSTNATPGHGHALDVDTRFGKVMRVTARTMRWAVQRLLEKHAKVIVRFDPGNHDPHVAISLGLIVEAYFESDPRVTVETTAAVHSYVVFGKNLIGTHHGDKTKFSDLPAVMANDRAEDWGRTVFRVWHCGHVHHDSVKEHPGCTVETHQTLAAKDAWHAGKGYRSRRSMKAITYHKEFGEVHRSRCDIAMLRAAA